MSIEGKMQGIENKVLTVTHEGLIKRLEEERATLNAIKDELARKIKTWKSSEDNFEITLSQSEPMFTNPAVMRENSNFEIRQLLSIVWFGGILYYKKKQ